MQCARRRHTARRLVVGGADRILYFGLHMRTLLCLLIGAGWLDCASTAAAAETPGGRVRLSNEFLSALVEEARTNHPGLRAAQLRQSAAEREAAAVRLWEDPMFRFGGVVGNDPGPDLEMEGDLLYEVEQKLPLFGKATAMRREAEAAAGVAGASANYQFQILRRSLVQAAQQLALSEELLRIGQEDLVLVDRMTDFARERQRAGTESGFDLLRLENERQKRQQQLETQRLQRDFDRVTLNRLLARPADRSWPELELDGVAPAIPLSEELFSMGTKFEPRLQTMRQEIAMAEAGVEVSRRNRLPDLSLGVEGRQWSGSGDFREGMFTVGLNLPWFNRSRYRADLDRARHRADAARAEVDDYELDVRRELFRIWTRIDAARREALLYRDSIIPRSELAVQTALAAWGTGRGMFLELMDARRMLTEARVMHVRALAEQHQMIADLITCCGVAELDSLLMLGARPDSPDPDRPASPTPTPVPTPTPAPQ